MSYGSFYGAVYILYQFLISKENQNGQKQKSSSWVISTSAPVLSAAKFSVKLVFTIWSHAKRFIERPLPFSLL